MCVFLIEAKPKIEEYLKILLAERASENSIAKQSLRTKKVHYRRLRAVIFLDILKTTS